MKRTTLALLLLACLAAPVLPYSSSEIKKMFDQSVATQDLRLRYALRVKIAQASPASAYGKISKVYILNASGAIDPRQEVALYSEAIVLDPGIFVAYFNRGLVYNRLGEAGKAAADFSKVIKMAPSYAGAYTSRGDSYRMLGKNDLAFADYASALSLDPKDAVTYLNRGMLYTILKEHLKAIEDYNAAIRLEPDLYNAYLDRCVSYTELKEFDKARSDCDKAVELDPENSKAYASRGGLNLEMGLSGKAVADREKAAELSPENPKNWHTLAYAYFMDYKFEKSISAYKRAISLAPAFTAPLYGLCLTYAYNRQYKLSVNTADYLLEKDPADIRALTYKGDALAASGKPLEAIKCFSKAIASGGDNAEVRRARAGAYTDLGKYVTAIGDMNAAQKMEGKTLLNALSAARILYKQGETKTALSVFNNVFSTGPNTAKRLRKELAIGAPYYSAKRTADLKALLKLHDAASGQAEEAGPVEEEEP